MAISRNPQEFLERYGLSRAHFVPQPRLAIEDLRIHGVPIEAPAPEQAILETYEGDPKPDRGAARPWPNQ